MPGSFNIQKLINVTPHLNTLKEKKYVLISKCCICLVESNSAALRTIAHQAPLSMGFSSKEYWSGLPFPVLRELSDPRAGLASPLSSALVGRFFTSSTTWKAPIISTDEDKAFDKIQHLFGLPWWLSGKEFTCSAWDTVQSLSQEDALEEGMATHSSILAWRIPWSKGPGGLQSIGSQGVGWMKRFAQHLFMIETQQTRNRGDIPHLIKKIYIKPTTNILNG